MLDMMVHKSRNNAPLHLWMPEMDSWQNSTSKWWSKNFLDFYFFVEKNNFENAKIFFQFFFEKIFFREKSDFSFRKKLRKCIFKKSENFQNFIFFHFEKYFFNEKIKVEKKTGSSFRCRICQESIFGILKCNGALSQGLADQNVSETPGFFSYHSVSAMQPFIEFHKEIHSIIQKLMNLISFTVMTVSECFRINFCAMNHK